ncbi:hypothetical protein EYC08_17525 [Tabrizicola sp. WMC-M-20]|nr:hypothetical protein EYC08_17525 [Tabrizicola sp. WMC-M-20]
MRTGTDAQERQRGHNVVLAGVMLAISLLVWPLLAAAAPDRSPRPVPRPLAEEVPDVGPVVRSPTMPKAEADPVAQPAFGDGQPPRHIGPLDQSGPPPEPPTIQPPAFDLAHHRPEDFLEHRRTLRLAYAETAPDQRADRGLDLAGFLLAHVWVLEGRSTLAVLGPDGLTGQQLARWHALDLAFRLLSDKARTAEPMLDPAHADWPDAPVWSVVHALRKGQLRPDTIDLSRAVDRLADYPLPLQQALLPDLLEAATLTAQWQVSSRIAERFAAFPQMLASPAYSFLLGQAAATLGQTEAAFDAFTVAAQGRDAHAQRARLAMVEMGLSGGLVSQTQTRDVLRDVRHQWRGDRLELQVLVRLAQINEDLSDLPEALAGMGEILTLFPGTPEAQLASERAALLLDRYYRDGMDGKLPLAEFLVVHRRIASDFRGFEGFDSVAEHLATRLRDAGANLAAAAEYAAIRAAVEAGQAHRSWPVDPARLVALRIAEAGALLDAGQVDAADHALPAATSGAGALQEQLDTLRARIASAQGNPTISPPRTGHASATHLRLLARAGRDAGNWPEALTRYQQLWARFPDEFRSADAAGLLLAAHHVGDIALAQRVATAFPTLGSDADPDPDANPAGGTLADIILHQPAPVSPLRNEAAEARLSQAGSTILTIGAIGQDPSADEQGGQDP